MKSKVWIVFSLSLVGCGHFETGPKVVHFPYAPELLKTVQTQNPSRRPASLLEMSASEEKSPRRVYFTSLYHQHLVLASHLGRANAINACPQFHHDKVEVDAFDVPKVALYKENQVEDDGKNFFPELVFNKKFSLNDYHLSLQEELEALCEEGVSDNSFKFDNLITYHAKKMTFHMKPSAMESVLKIPIFANFYLIKMIEARHQVVLNHPEEKRFIKLTETHWFERYVAEASRLRGQFLRNKMVKR